MKLKKKLGIKSFGFRIFFVAPILISKLDFGFVYRNLVLVIHYKTYGTYVLMLFY